MTSHIKSHASYLIDLSGLDSKKCQAILRFKSKINKDKSLLSESIMTGNIFNCNMEIDEFGENAVKFLQKQHREFSADEIDTIIASYESGKSTLELGEQFNCCKNTINNILRTHGVKITKYKAQEKLNEAKVITMYEEMYTTEEIAKYFNVSVRTIRRYLKDHNIPRRNRWDYPRI